MLDLFGIKNQEKPIEEQPEDKPLDIFAYLKDIMVHKKGNLNVRDPFMTKFNTFMILKFLSLDEGYIHYINLLNQYQDLWTKEQAYKLLVLTIPRTNKYLKFPKKADKDFDDDELSLIAKYFECAKHEAEQFVKLGFIGKKDLEKIKQMFGGRV